MGLSGAVVTAVFGVAGAAIMVHGIRVWRRGCPSVWPRERRGPGSFSSCCVLLGGGIGLAAVVRVVGADGPLGVTFSVLGLGMVVASLIVAQIKWARQSAPGVTSPRRAAGAPAVPTSGPRGQARDPQDQAPRALVASFRQ